MRPIPVMIMMTLTLAPASALALTVSAAAGQSVPNPLILKVPRRVGFGQPVKITGSTPSTDAGRDVVLESAPRAGTPWRALTATRTGSRGRFRFRLVPRTSALLRVVESPGPSATPAIAAVRGAAPSATGAPASALTPLTVAPRLSVHRHRFAVLGRGGIRVAGRLLPAAAGRNIRLQGHTSTGWRTVARGRTGRRGGFTLHYAPGSGTRRRLRVLFAGDSQNARAKSAAGTVTVFSQDVASWYDDGGATACGFHAGLGVANRTLPCGTRVAFHHGGRTVSAVVDDRGPYAGGRNWDLNQGTAAALGFAGVGTVWVSS